jgi:hypothetical protein
MLFNNNVKVKVSLYRHIEVSKVEAHRISRQTAHEGGRVVRPTYQPPLPLREDP